MSVATVVIGGFLRTSEWFLKIGILKIVTPAGRQTLTLYMAHILIGMGMLEAVGMLGGQSQPVALSAALAFCAIATAYAYLWAKFFKHGPIEAVMRNVAGEAPHRRSKNHD